MLLTLFSLLPFIQLFITGSDGCNYFTNCENSCCSLQNMTAPTTRECNDCLYNPPFCASGQLIKDICKCCEVCAKAEGEKCKRIGRYPDPCADNLYCDIPLPEPTTDKIPVISCPNIEGICRKMIADKSQPDVGKAKMKPIDDTKVSDDNTNQIEGRSKYFIVDVGVEDVLN